MNTPNKLTMLRVILIPFFVVFLCFSDPDRDFPDHLSVAEPQCSFHAGITYRRDIKAGRKDICISFANTYILSFGIDPMALLFYPRRSIFIIDSIRSIFAVSCGDFPFFNAFAIISISPGLNCSPFLLELAAADIKNASISF